MESLAEKQNMDEPSHDENESRKDGTGRRRNNKNLPPLFLYIEAGNLRRAAERARRHPKEVKTWASIKIKSAAGVGDQESPATIKRLALHHACFKLRTNARNVGRDVVIEEDPFIEACRFILLLVEIYPDACGMRETRHGCLPLHLAAFASCVQSLNDVTSKINLDPSFQNNNSHASLVSANPVSSETFTPSSTIIKPSVVSSNHRSASESTADTMRTTMSIAIADENFTGLQTEYTDVFNQQQPLRQLSHLSIEAESSNVPQPSVVGSSQQQQHPQLRIQSISIGSHIFISEKREEYALKVINSLLDAYPRGIRMESEGKRLALHTAAAGRATPRVMTTLITAYPAAARHRNKDGFLPLHLCAHWGVSSPNVVVSMLKQYPDVTFGRNRFERTPLEEALCMAGENGRPHQASLVRALRKHPSYWTRPEAVIFNHLQQQIPASRGSIKHNIVDIDETLDSMDETTHECDDSDDEDHLFLDCSPYADSHNEYGITPANNRNEFTKNESLSPIENDVQILIQHKSWSAAGQRLMMTPTDANLNLKVITRGGFISSAEFTPLHYACERRPPKEFIQKLIRIRPDAVKKRTMPGGALPLHISCTWHAKQETVNILLATDPNGCKISDELGNLPLHSACFSGTSVEVISALLKAYPKAVLVRNSHGSLPEDITLRLKHDNRIPVLALLTLCRDEILTKKKMKHRRNKSEGCITTAKNDAMVLNERCSHVDPVSQAIENIDSGEVEVKYSDNSANDELMWI